MRFEFEADDGKRYQTVARTHQTEKLEDDKLEPLLYLPADPRQATLIDHLPGAPRINPDGTIARRPEMAALALVCVAAGVTINLVGAWLALR
jgi:hypothetical protein